MTQCNHTSCTDSADTTVHLSDGESYELCEDHANMTPKGYPVEGYKPNNPEKFSLDA